MRKGEAGGRKGSGGEGGKERRTGGERGNGGRRKRSGGEEQRPPSRLDTHCLRKSGLLKIGRHIAQGDQLGAL